MIDYYRVAGPLIRKLDPECAHGLAIRAMKTGLVPGQPVSKANGLKIRLFGLDFPNPIGLAAGFDKNAEVADAMLGQGFGFVEVGTVTPRPQPGNPHPRMFRLVEDKAVINRMGFNNEGAAAMARRLAKRRRHGIVGVNLGKNKDTQDGPADYETGIAALGALADYLVINISSPNTPGLRALQGRDSLIELIERAQASRRKLPAPPPLLLKIAPDLGERDLEDIAEVALSGGLDGLVVTNTTIERPPGLISPHRGETGGLSGPPLLGPSTRILADLYRLTGGRLPLVGSGGISNGADAYAKIRAGASLVQIYTALIYQGTGLVSRIAQDLVVRLGRDGFTSIADAVGADHRT